MQINTILQHKTEEKTWLFMWDIKDENSHGPVFFSPDHQGVQNLKLYNR